MKKHPELKDFNNAKLNEDLINKCEGKQACTTQLDHKAYFTSNIKLDDIENSNEYYLFA